MKQRENSTIKLLIYILVFLVIILLFLLFFIIPNIKSYKSNRVELDRVLQEVKELKDEKEHLAKEIASVRKEKAPIFKRLEEPMKPEKFQKFAQKYLHDVTIKPLPKRSRKRFKAFEVDAKTATKSPQAFFQFMKELKSYPTIIKLTFPIVISSKSNHLNIHFVIQAYQISKK